MPVPARSRSRCRRPPRRHQGPARTARCTGGSGASGRGGTSVGATRGRPEPVAGASDRLDQAVATTVVDLPTEAVDVDLDDIRFRREVSIPERLDQALLGKDLARMAGQELEQRELAGREADPATASLNAKRRGVELEIADNHSRGSIVHAAALQRANPCPELCDRERLREVVIGASIEAFDTVGDAIERCQHEDRRVEPTPAERRAHLETVDPGEDDVEDDHFVRKGSGPFERQGAVGDDIDGMAVSDETPANGVGDRRFVLHDEDAQSSPPEMVWRPPIPIAQAVMAAEDAVTLADGLFVDPTTGLRRIPTWRATVRAAHEAGCSGATARRSS